MPLTPFHLGPGVLFKALGGSHVSLTVFALAQVAMDLEVVVRAGLGSSHLHGFTNTIAGATVVLLVTVPVGKPLCERLLRWWNRNVSPGQARWLQVSTCIPSAAAWAGGVLGVYSHLILDAMMHADARPWTPFAEGNPLVGYLSVAQLYLACLLCLLTGGAILAIYRAIKLRRAR